MFSALLLTCRNQVGGIVWTKGGEKGTTVKRGDELGYFAYGGSTIVALWPKGLIKCVSSSPTP